MSISGSRGSLESPGPSDDAVGDDFDPVFCFESFRPESTMPVRSDMLPRLQRSERLVRIIWKVSLIRVIGNRLCLADESLLDLDQDATCSAPQIGPQE